MNEPLQAYQSFKPLRYSLIFCLEFFERLDKGSFSVSESDDSCSVDKSGESGTVVREFLEGPGYIYTSITN